MVRAKSAVVGAIDRLSIGHGGSFVAHDECDFVPSVLDRRKPSSNYMIGREVAG
jgi:hypothetical protein